MDGDAGYLMAKRRPKRSQGDLEAEVLKGRWADLRHNESLHSTEDNHHARRRCRQLIEGGIESISWDELTGRQ